MRQGGNHPRSREEALGDEQRYWRPMAPVCPRHMDRRLFMAIRVVRKNIARFDRDQTDGQRAVLCAKKCLPTDIRYKKTRAMRRALTKHEASIKSAKQQVKSRI
ncbi:hypothetical protein PRIPAC_86853 [Pristionchus pacificus]|uniref:Large ribosomal subunit protein uL29 n=1 Tax=Pristionchus pacificus TaxID=54126 RepID=A0A2A6BSR0_PRIPA|nr:hypothetical protein PRIPAC_86853 [Pristionchus pacificus]|eukprot:PDM68930.1 hypothetical protein PRIPAC_47232 [Pristionchus pacificus]